MIYHTPFAALFPHPAMFDSSSAYHLIHIHEGDKWKTAFNIPLEHYEYLVYEYEYPLPYSRL